MPGNLTSDNHDCFVNKKCEFIVYTTGNDPGAGFPLVGKINRDVIPFHCSIEALPASCSAGELCSVSNLILMMDLVLLILTLMETEFC